MPPFHLLWEFAFLLIFCFVRKSGDYEATLGDVGSHAASDSTQFFPPPLISA